MPKDMSGGTVEVFDNPGYICRKIVEVNAL